MRTQQTLTSKGASDNAPPAGIDPNQYFSRDDRDQLVELLKRNHDIVVEKYEMQRHRVEGLEQTSIEKEKLYNEIKLEND